MFKYLFTPLESHIWGMKYLNLIRYFLNSSNEYGVVCLTLVGWPTYVEKMIFSLLKLLVIESPESGRVSVITLLLLSNSSIKTLPAIAACETLWPMAICFTSSAESSIILFVSVGKLCAEQDAVEATPTLLNSVYVEIPVLMIPVHHLFRR